MSQQLEEVHFKAEDGKWYISILPYEEAYEPDFHGPFETSHMAAEYSDENLPSSSGLEINDSGDEPRPIKFKINHHSMMVMVITS